MRNKLVNRFYTDEEGRVRPITAGGLKGSSTHPKMYRPQQFSQTPLEKQRVLTLISEAKDVRKDKITDNMTFVSYLADILIEKLRAGEETFAEQHVGTQYSSQSNGRPIETIYSPKLNYFTIYNGHHRWAEAKAAGRTHIEGWVSIFNEEKGSGTLTLDQLEERYTG